MYKADTNLVQPISFLEYYSFVCYKLDSPPQRFAITIFSIFFHVELHRELSFLSLCNVTQVLFS